MTRACLVLVLAATAACAPRGLDGPGDVGEAEHAIAAKELTVDFGGCVESIGVGLVSTDAARSLLPEDLIVVGEGTPVTPVVVRTADCGSVEVNGHSAEPGSVVQIGLVIVPPDGTGDINNYTLYYYTSHERLARRLDHLGVEAQRVEQLSYEVELGSGAATLSVNVPAPGDPPLSLAGTVIPSDVPVGSFHANWWSDGPTGRVKMATIVPSIAIGGADLGFAGPLDEDLAALGFSGIPGADFPALQQFNAFASAQMTATHAD